MFKRQGFSIRSAGQPVHAVVRCKAGPSSNSHLQHLALRGQHSGPQLDRSMLQQQMVRLALQQRAQRVVVRCQACARTREGSAARRGELGHG